MARLQHLTELLAGYQEQIQGMEEALELAEPLGIPRIKRNIGFIRKQMRPFEEEYWQLLAKEA